MNSNNFIRGIGQKNGTKLEIQVTENRKQVSVFYSCLMFQLGGLLHFFSVDFYILKLATGHLQNSPDVNGHILDRRRGLLRLRIKEMFSALFPGYTKVSV